MVTRIIFILTRRISGFLTSLLSLQGMKKVLAIVTLLVYFVVSTGFTLSFHYCMDKFSSIGIGYSDSHKCGTCGMDIDGGCCHDVVKVVKLTADYMAQNHIDADFQLALPPVTETAYLFIPLQNFSNIEAPVAHAPPPLPAEINILNSVFRI